MSSHEYDSLYFYMKLKEAEQEAQAAEKRYSHEEVFNKLLDQLAQVVDQA